MLSGLKRRNLFSFSGRRGKLILATLLILGVAFLAANFDYPKYWNSAADWVNPKIESVGIPLLQVPKFSEEPYSLGLDLQGGIQLIYRADLSDISQREEDDAMSALRDAIERRVNFLGVTEPVVQVEKGEDTSRLIVELAGIDDPDRAIEEIGKTPFLEFKTLRPQEKQVEILTSVTGPNDQSLFTEEEARSFCENAEPQQFSAIQQLAGQDPCFAPTNLTGRFLEGADLVSSPRTGGLQIALQFNSEGAELFADITSNNIGRPVAIFLDGRPISMPRVNQEITDGRAVITGSFSREEGQALARNLNAGALPVPIEIISQQRVGSSLGEESLNKSLTAGIIALLVVLGFLIVIYRFSGLLATLALGVYLALFLAVIKLVPITLTLAGIAGLILSIGMAVDANVLVFERLKEELTETDTVERAVDRAFDRAWPSIRDGNISTLLTAVILFYVATSFVQGFALMLGIGVAISLFSAMVVTRYLLKIFAPGRLSNYKALWSR